MHVELDIFSGRPNPRWMLSSADQARVARLMESLRLHAGTEVPEPPDLGYRGFTLTYRGQAVRAFGGYVHFAKGARSDPGRSVERLLLETLPAECSGLRPMLEVEIGRA